MTASQGSEHGEEEGGQGPIHVVETGEEWEVWRLGDSMPLGRYPTVFEAREHAEAQAEIDGVAVVEDDLPEVPVAPAVTPPTEIPDR